MLPATSLVTAAMESQLTARTVLSITSLQDQDQLALFVLMEASLLRETLPVQTAMLPAPLVMGLRLSA